MSGKIIDQLSGEEIDIDYIETYCTNPELDSDNWHTTDKVLASYATKEISLEQVPDADYQVFALFDDGRSEGSVWYPVHFTEAKTK